jgi:hypothetical protein
MVISFLIANFSGHPEKQVVWVVGAAFQPRNEMIAAGKPLPLNLIGYLPLPDECAVLG